MIYCNGVAFESNKALNMFSASLKLCFEPFPKQLPEIEYISEMLAERFLYVGLLRFGGMIENKSIIVRRKMLKSVDNLLSSSEKSALSLWFNL